MVSLSEYKRGLLALAEVGALLSGIPLINVIFTSVSLCKERKKNTYLRTKMINNIWTCSVSWGVQLNHIYYNTKHVCKAWNSQLDFRHNLVI